MVKFINSNLMSEAFSVETLMHGELRIIISKQGEKVPELGTVYKYQFAGSFISDKNIVEISNKWHSLEGSGLIIPSCLHSEIKTKSMDGGRIGQLLTGGYHNNSDQWKKHIKFNTG